jgi:hypothetical protein
MEKIKNNFEKAIEEAKAKGTISDNQEDLAVALGGIDLGQVFEELEISLEEYRRKSQEKFQQSEI